VIVSFARNRSRSLSSFLPTPFRLSATVLLEPALITAEPEPSATVFLTALRRADAAVATGLPPFNVSIADSLSPKSHEPAPEQPSSTRTERPDTVMLPTFGVADAAVPVSAVVGVVVVVAVVVVVEPGELAAVAVSDADWPLLAEWRSVAP